ncbi:NACHT, LRR and PYD domains-containing protein 12 [Betta splendens]|uniref:NACHT, LRR and PYD domains-containing protein 12 n=1 Tax=Betta splendens TaxID=158456 RepID=A0A6P7MXM7_BETSP|nr:NACHT, LRR and PYD domains-containing protein 12 [Betta splendens]
MDKDAVLRHMLNLKGVSVEEPVSAVSAVAAGAAGAQASGSADRAVLSALSGTRTVLLVGGEGSGKTTVLEKLLVDWAKGEVLQNFSHVFYLGPRDFGAVEQSLSLEALLRRHHSRVGPGSILRLLQRPEDVLLVIDDLHRFGPSLDASALCCDPSRAVPVPCLLAGLLRGSLLSGAALVVASRPTGASTLLSGTTVELLGFLEPQRQAYFNRVFTDPAAADKALKHMERTLGFYDFCASPGFCRTVGSVYRSLMDAGKELPETLSQLCVDILVQQIQALSLNQPGTRGLVLALGRMASRCCPRGHSSCTTEEVVGFGLQPFLSSLGVFLKVDGDAEGDCCVLSFRSQLLLEFIRAVCFLLGESGPEGVERMLGTCEQHAGFVDLLLCGLSEPAQRAPLEAALGELSSDRSRRFRSWFKSSSRTWLRGCCKERHRRCLRGLYEAQNEQWVREVIVPSSRRCLGCGDMSLQDCVALTYVVACLGELEELNLCRTEGLSERQAEALAPAMGASHRVRLSHSSLNAAAVAHLASALRRGITGELDLSHTRLGDEKFSILSSGLRDCKLRKLNLHACDLTRCEDLLPLLTSSTSQLCVLMMMFNPIGDRGLTQLCTALHSSHCRLQELWLRSCQLTAASMEAFSAAVCSGKSDLTKVDLTQNSVGDGGVEALCRSLQHPLCKLQSLTLFDNELTGACCPHVMRALMSEHCSLSELDLSVNELGQEGALLLCRALARPGCPIEKLGLKRCELTQSVFKELGSVLKGGTGLKSLIVGLNKVGDRGVKHLLEAVAHPTCLLEELDVEMTGLTDACAEDLCAAVKTSKTLKHLELSNNSLTDASVPALVRVMKSSDSVQEMNLKYNDFSEDAFDVLEECPKIRY